MITLALFVILAVIAVFGVLCLIRMAAGWALDGGDGGYVVCVCRPDGKERPFLEQVLLLKRMGLLNGQVLLIDQGISADTLKWMKNGAFRCISPEELPEYLELERNQLA